MAKIIVNSGHNQVLGTDQEDNCEDSFGPEYLAYRKEWSERPKGFDAGRFPLHVDIESTNSCNLRCVMCPRNFVQEEIEKNLGNMEWDLYRKIIDECAENGLPSIKLNYRGEPLLHPDIVKMVKYAKDKGITEVQFNTNGMLLDEKKSRELITAGLDRIIFSFDGATKNTYENIRSGASFERVVSNIRRFIKTRDSMSSKRPCVRVQMVKMKQNEKEVDGFIKLWTPVANRVAISTKREVRDKAKDAGHFPCPQLWQRIMICWDGEIRVCCGDWNGGITKMFGMGNIKDTTIKDIWNSEKYQKLRLAHKSENYGGIPVCSKCEINTPRIDNELSATIDKYKKCKG
jgi:MoaA/NifB/PqqE/SkfB family radical SAM enzyme